MDNDGPDRRPADRAVLSETSARRNGRVIDPALLARQQTSTGAPTSDEPEPADDADPAAPASGDADQVGPGGDGDPAAPVAAGSSDEPVDVWDRRVATGLAFLRRRLTGDYEVDEFGFDSELTDHVFHPLVRLLYRDWFRTEVHGLENLPLDSAGLVVANHSGTVALDALVLSAVIRDRHPNRRYLRLLGADLVFRMPIVSELARKSGGTVACNPDAERLLSQGQLVGVFPEGFKGVGKRYADRYKLQRFGRGGFVSAALRTGQPIVPVAIVGGEETYPMLADVKPLARLLKLPYFPLTPTFPWLGPLGLVPLPSKWLIEFCPPIPTAHLVEHADDPLVIFNLADQVRETIQHTLHRLLERRPDPFGL